MAMSDATRRRRAGNVSDPIEDKVAVAYRLHFDRVSVRMLDISKIMDVGRNALKEGRDLDEAMAAAVPQFRQD